MLYIEACESGSMFNGLLPDNLKIYATTAATPFESSYAWYVRVRGGCARLVACAHSDGCGSDMNDHLGVYLSDCYSVRACECRRCECRRGA